MFHSCGFFSTFPCPFYVNGLCERPYCHFRHSSKDVEKARENAPSILQDDDTGSTESSVSAGSESSTSINGQTSESSTDPKTSVSRTLELVSTPHLVKTSPQIDSVSQESSAGSFSIPSFTNTSYQVPIAEEPEYATFPETDPNQSLFANPNSGSSALPTYLPTPKTPSLPVPEPATDDFGVPVYQPTPKVELKRRRVDKVPKAKSADLEYDPECNFACEGLISSSSDKLATQNDLVSGYEPTKISQTDDAVDYRPAAKKAHLSGKINRSRLSCESLIGSSPSAVNDDEDESMPEGEFSDDDGEDTNEEVPMDKDGEGKNTSDSFENIGDDDISSDEDFIDLPDVSVGNSSIKQQKHSVSKSSGRMSDVSKHQNKSAMKDNESKTVMSSKQKRSFNQNQEKVKITDKSSSDKSDKHQKSDKMSSSHKIAKVSSLHKTHKLSSSHRSNKLLSHKSDKLSSSLKANKPSSSSSHKSDKTSSSSSHKSNKTSSSSNKFVKTSSLSSRKLDKASSSSNKSDKTTSSSSHKLDKTSSSSPIKSSSSSHKLYKTSSHKSDQTTPQSLDTSVKSDSSHKADKSLNQKGKSTSETLLKTESRKSSSASLKEYSSEKGSDEKRLQSTNQSSHRSSEYSSKTTNSHVKVRKEVSHSPKDEPSLNKKIPKSSSSEKLYASKERSGSKDKNPESKKSSSHRSGSSSQSRRSSVDGKSENAEYSSKKSKDVNSKLSGNQKPSKTDSRNVSTGKVKSSESDEMFRSSSKRDKLSSGDKRSSTDSRSSDTRRQSSSDSRKEVHKHHSRSPSDAKDVRDKDKSKNKSSHSDKKYDTNKKDYKLSSSGSTKKSSSDKQTKNTGSNSRPRKEKSSHRSDSDSRDSHTTLQKINSSIFGDDTDEDVEEMAHDDDDVASEFMNDRHDSPALEEESYVDYSAFINDSDFEDEDTFEECFRIFKEDPIPKQNSGQQVKKLTKDQKKDGATSNDVADNIPGKKRTAYKGAEEIRRPTLVRKDRPRHILSPMEVMHNRIMEMQRRALEQAKKQAVQEQEVSSTSGAASTSKPQSSSSGGEKKRVAHEPKPLAPASTSKTKASSSKAPSKTTIAITASKTEKRVAHTPNLSNLKRPVIPTSFGDKVPSNVRQSYLNRIIDECLKFCPSEEEAFKKGLEEEAGVYDRANNRNIYLRVAVNTISRLRTEGKQQLPGSSKSQQHWGMSQSHEAQLGGARAAKTNFTLHRYTGAGKKTEVVLTAPELYQRLLKYSMTTEQLQDNGYPLPCPDVPGKAIIMGKSYQQTDTLLKDNERTCARCGKRFIVNADGSYVNSEECVYHWTRAYPRKKSGFIQLIYNCCNSDSSSQGCQVASNHVHDRNKRDGVHGFMRTMPRSPPRDGNFGIYALDCEMVYTVGGLELARVTVVNVDGDTVYESLVQPFNSIVDYNTRFSGLTASDLQDVDVTLTQVQAVLLSRFSDKSILIGHSLESDLFALKLIHSTVVDTSVVFPHRLGPPYKRALKNLMLEIFQKIIQCDEGGHDSKEDALACLQLMKWRIKEDSKRESRYSRD